jgi:hypothetical protein
VRDRFLFVGGDDRAFRSVTGAESVAGFGFRVERFGR